MAEKNKLRYSMTLRLYKEDKAFGPGIAALLEKVQETGSLQKAAESMNMAYSKAWKMIRSMEEQWGFPLTYRNAGGKDGGGSVLTPEAEELIKRYWQFCQKAEQEMNRLFEEVYPEQWQQEMEGRSREEMKKTGNKKK